MFHVKHSLPARTVACIVLALVLTVTGCVVSENPVTGRKRAYGYSWADEVQLGRQADQQIVAQYGLYDDEQLARYVTRIGQEVLAESHLRRPDAEPEFRNTEFTFRVLDSPVVNAFALPGGFVYVTRGLLAHLNNEAQLAMVLGHEVAHVAARHASKRAATQTFQQIGLIGGAVLAQETLGGAAGENILNAGGTVSQLLLLSYGREDEREADDLGVEYAALANYAAGEGSAFFRSLDRLGEQSGQDLPSWLSTHPEPYEREQRIQELAAEWRQRTQMTRVDQATYLQQIDGIVLGEDPRQGYTDDGVFFHPELRFRFPTPNGFQTINQPTQVAMVSSQQDAIVLFTIATDATSAEGAARQLIQEAQLNPTDAGATTVNGLPAYAFTAQAQTQQGQTLGLLIYFIEYDGNVYRFVGYTTADRFGTYRDAFTRTMRGFAPLTDRRRINVQPTRMDVQNASRSAAFRSFVPSSLPDALTPEELAILNQVELDESVSAGRPLKLTR